MTAGQQRALDELWPNYGTTFSMQPLDLAKLFGRDAKTIFEIGFGNGESLLQLASHYPNRNFLGVEVHEPGIGHCMIGASAAKLQNLRILCHDAIEVLEDQMLDESLTRVNLYFPDPWPKKRHHKRRIVQPSFLDLVSRKLQQGGTLHIATDWNNYAEYIDATVADSENFEVDVRRAHRGDQPLDRSATRFESRGLQQGHQIVDWRLVRR